MAKVNVNLEILPIVIKKLQQQVEVTRKELKMIPATDLRENEPWHIAKNAHDTTVKKYEEAVNQRMKLLENPIDINTYKISLGDLLRITNINTGVERVLYLAEEGDSLIREALSIESRLGDQIYKQMPGKFIILTEESKTIAYDVQLVQDSETELVKEFIERQAADTETLVKALLHSVDIHND